MKGFDSNAWVKETFRLREQKTLPTRLYKFLSLDAIKSPFGLKSLNDALLNHRLYLSSPRNFNDISDCRVQLDSSGSSEDILKMQKDVFSRHAGIKPKEAKKELHKRNISRKNVVNAIIKSAKTQIDAYGITCFTECISSPAQWAHYADNHSGLAIEFRWDGFSEEFPAFPVRYVEQLPKINIIKDDFGSMYLLGGHTKSRDWSYEKEWRIVKLDSANTYLDISSDRVTGVILGANCKPATEQLIRDINSELEKIKHEPIKIKKARLSETSYSIICDE